MKGSLLVFLSILVIYLNYFAFCGTPPISEILDSESQNDDSSGDTFDTSYYNDKGPGENIFLQTDKNKGASETPSTDSTTTTTTTTTTKSSHTTTTTEEPKTKTMGSKTEHPESSTISEKSTEEYPTYAPCPPCTTNFALGTFFFGNFFGMALMLVMGYIYLSWLRRTSSIPQSARLY
uniref:Uncharacterized protein n=1 Tax=Strongyloides papillosus TaxID=174720 RepID=A0A0N5CCX5_STREA